MARRGVEFELVGLAGLTFDLDSLSAAIRDRVVDAIDDTAHAVQAGAKTRVPFKTGDLARAIALEGRGLTRRIGLTDAVVSSRRQGNTAHANPWVYGQWYEHGFRTRNIAAHPFMGPAVDQEEPNHLRRMEAALNEAMK